MLFLLEKAVTRTRCAVPLLWQQSEPSGAVNFPVLSGAGVSSLLPLLLVLEECTFKYQGVIIWTSPPFLMCCCYYYYFIFFKQSIIMLLLLLASLNPQPNIFIADTLPPYNLWALPWIAADAFRLSSPIILTCLVIMLDMGWITP